MSCVYLSSNTVVNLGEIKMKQSPWQRFYRLATSLVLTLVVSVGLIFGVSVQSASAGGYDPFLGEVMLFGGTYCPDGWAEANGQTLSVPQNAALYSLYGNTYGGDGRTTFALPDLRGREPVGQGQGPGLSPYVLGQTGLAKVTKPDPANTVALPTGYLAVRYCVATQGIYPSRP
jgi:microcystin-dependent protein